MTTADETLDTSDAWNELATSAIGRRIAERYIVHSRLGEGSFGAVYGAHDEVTHRDVAIKLLRRLDEPDRVRFLREMAMLRLLRLPGVVSLLDDGVDDNGLVYLVTDRIAGTAFPGVVGKVPWTQISETAIGLLETIGRVHAAGITHLDIKPANVLVDSGGQATVIDFGISIEIVNRQRRHGIAGTPAYIAPEQVRQRKMDGRADLYAIGVMLYEALSGRLPLTASTSTVLLELKIRERPPPLAEVAPEVPADVCAAVDAMLRTAPHHRPRTAEAVLAMLDHHPPTAPMFRLGPSEVLERVLDRIGAGKPVEIMGGPRSGRTRLLDDVAECLRARGTSVVRIDPESHTRPPAPVQVVLVDDAALLPAHVADNLAAYGATRVAVVNRPTTEVVRLRPLTVRELEPLFHGPEIVFHYQSDAALELHRRTRGHQGEVMDELAAWIRAGLCHWDEGRVRIDRVSIDRLRMSLPRMSPTGSIDLDDDLVVAGLQDARRRALADSTAEVAPLARSRADAPLPADDTAVGSAGVDGRLESFEDTLVESIQETLSSELSESLEDDTGPPTRRDPGPHESLLTGLPPDSPRRVRLLVAHHMTAEAAYEALRIARLLYDLGRQSEAFSAAGEALRLARLCRDGHTARAALALYAGIGCGYLGPRHNDMAIYEAERERGSNSLVGPIVRLLRAVAQLIVNGKPPDPALAASGTLGPFDDELLERWRLTLVVADWTHTGTWPELATRELEAWLANDATQDRIKTAVGWSALRLYRELRFDAAANRHQLAATRRNPADSVLSLMNAAGARLDAYQLDEAARLAREVLDRARTLREPRSEAAALVCLAEAQYRGGQTPEGLDELLAAIAGAWPNQGAGCALTLAAVHWRAGRMAAAVDAAREAEHLFALSNWPPAVDLARALQAAAGSPPSMAVLAEAQNRALVSELPGAAIQTLGLLARAGALHRSVDRSTVHGLLEQLPRTLWAQRREVISPHEACVHLGVSF